MCSVGMCGCVSVWVYVCAGVAGCMCVMCEHVCTCACFVCLCAGVCIHVCVMCVVCVVWYRVVDSVA